MDEITALKSWHIQMIGVLAQAVVVATVIGGFVGAQQIGAESAAMALTVFLVFAFAASTLAVLLAREETRQMGGVLSVLLGVGSLPIPAVQYIAVFPLLAGMYALWQHQ